MGDILVRDVDDLAISKIEEAAKKEKVSRQVYLKSLLERVAHYDVFIEERDRFEKVVMASQKQMEQYLRQQSELYESVSRIESILYLLLDSDAEEINQQLTELIGKVVK
ncbi:hypothetical protein V4V34_22195 [Lysinibacillus sphaericus]|uniref:hypothetical protein n=1 Tax=Lysinibacillus TaxID=400634 RepID=UPI00055BB737|nr:hypothetical protein [Lysinibacillus sphaericus]MBG9754962.1 hypothetical protein [Lysinibacillus sphaericus]MEE3806740.1 hypothetical protein [Lysinibacillus fusiformis]QTB15473.1 hypothetical protein J2B92_09925 [Lysinibacillus sphaericus]QTB24406.1 hypothetical protein J1907_10345 [Lysinibacillus sphaericus]